jgi:lysozyme family protein
MVNCHFESFDYAQDELKSRSYWTQSLKNEVSTALDLTTFCFMINHGYSKLPIRFNNYQYLFL